MTFLEAINAVQRRLRETETAASNTSTYSKLIGEFVNQAKREVEDAWNWTQLRTVLPVTTSNGTSNYTITGAGDRYRLLRDPNTGGALVWDDTNDAWLGEVNYGWMQQALLSASPQSAYPAYFNVYGVSSGDPTVDFYPIPDAAYSIKFHMVLPQTDFALDGTDDAVAIKVPSHPVVLRAYELAIAERGEDAGISTGGAMSLYMSALSDAIALDASLAANELMWSAP